jgi:hypothetical protein
LTDRRKKRKINKLGVSFCTSERLENTKTMTSLLLGQVQGGALHITLPRLAAVQNLLIAASQSYVLCPFIIALPCPRPL